MSTVVNIHEHQWCYHGDLVLEDVSRHRQEWCLSCGAIRVQFDSGWYYQYTDDFREMVETGAVVEKDKYLGSVPDRSMAPAKVMPMRNRLGRGLRDLKSNEFPNRFLNTILPKKADS